MSSNRTLLEGRGLRPNKALGQNFLTDPNIVLKIIRLAGLEGGEPVVEIGPGLGALTRPLLAAGHPVTAIELDRGLAAYLREELAGFEGLFGLVEGDALEADLSPGALNLAGPYAMLGNLPYQISSPLLFRLLEHPGWARRGVFMFQAEFARRLSAAPGGKDYGRLGAVFGVLGRVRPLFTVGPQAFYPRPRVSSTVVEIIFENSMAAGLTSRSALFEVVRACFAARRKTLANNMKAAYGDAGLGLLETAGIGPRQRAEEIPPPGFIALANALWAWKSGFSGLNSLPNHV